MTPWDPTDVILNPIGPLRPSVVLQTPCGLPDVLLYPLGTFSSFPKLLGQRPPELGEKPKRTTILNREITPKSSREVRNIRCFQNWLVVFRYQSSIVFRMFFHNLQLCQSPWRKNLKLCTAPFRTFSAHFLHSSILGQSTDVTQVMQYLK